MTFPSTSEHSNNKHKAVIELHNLITDKNDSNNDIHNVKYCKAIVGDTQNNFAS